MVTLNDLNKQSQVSGEQQTPSPQPTPTGNGINQKAPLAGLGNLLKPITDIKNPILPGLLGKNLGDVTKNTVNAIGGTVGAGLALPAGFASGAIGGPATFLGVEAAGAGAGGAITDTTEQGIENLLGFQKGFSGSEVLSSGVANAVAAPLGTLGESLLTGVMSKMTGLGSDSIHDIFNNSEKYAEGSKGGRAGLTNLVKNLSESVKEYSGKIGDFYQENLKPIANKAIGVSKDALNGLNQGIQKILDDNGIKSLFDTTGNFAKSFIDRYDIPKLQAVFNSVSEINEKTTIQDLNTTIRRLANARDFSKQADGSADAIMGKIYNQLTDFVKDNVPDLDAIRAKIRPVEVFVNNMKDLMPKDVNNTQAVDSAANKLLGLVHQGGTETENLLKGASENLKGGIDAGVKVSEDAAKTAGDAYKKTIGSYLGGVKQSGGEMTNANPYRIRGQFFAGIPKVILNAVVGLEGTGEATVGNLLKGLAKFGLSEDTVKTIIQEIGQKTQNKK